MASPKASSPPVKAVSAQQQAMHRLGLRTDWDLVLHLPLRHEDETRIDALADGRDGQTLQFEGMVTHSEVSLRPRRQLRVTVLDVADGRSSCVLRFMHFYPQHQKALAVGERVRVRGDVRVGLWGREMVHPTFKPASAPLPQGLTPVYPSGAGLSQAYLRKAVAGALQRSLDERRWCDTLTVEISNEIGLHRLFDMRKSLLFLHSPTPDSAAVLQGDRDHPAWQRLKLEELLAQQLSQLVARRERARSRAPVLAEPGMAAASPVSTSTLSTARGAEESPAQTSQPLQPCLADALLAALPFGLTGAQTRVSAEIAADLARPVPMHRLLQGDVGAGKTVVAALAACRCMDAGWQCALMAPTEILAQQHFAKLVGWLAPLLAQRGLTVAWLTGSQKKKEREAMAAQVASGQAGLVVGTHALIQEDVKFARLGLAVIDEQHRFGVAQRLALRGKLEGSAQADGAREPHLLMMTATPIPRTLAMSHLADLDVSTLDELPPGRTPIVTRVVSDERRDEVVERIAAQVAQGRQVYWVCPLIQESEAAQNASQTSTALDDGRKLALQDLRNVTDTHAELSDALPGVGVGLLHSRLPPAEKQAVMDAFARGELAVLVSTTVIEVGVDVPNASLMVIDHAERFGLSQLHQLRGRVGRGAAASACVLLYTAPLSPTGRERLKAMAQTNDGFEIARIDLALRGPGEFLGARQSGEAMLRFADLATDEALLEQARHAAPLMLDRYPAQAQAHMQRWLGARAEFLKA